MRYLALIVLLLCLAASSSSLRQRRILGDRPEIKITPVVLDRSNPLRFKVGQLTFIGGVALSSNDDAFGSFSAMRVNGNAFTLLSDSGNIVKFQMRDDFRPNDIAFADLPGPGTGLWKRDRDTESLTQDPDTGKIWIGYERRNAIWRYNASMTRAEAAARPLAMADWPKGGGAEAMVRLRNGAFLIISEMGRPAGRADARVMLRFEADPTESGEQPQQLAYVPPEGYDPTDATQLPDGRLLVLNRRFSLPELFTAKLVLVDIAHKRADGVYQGQEVATFAAPVLHDNFEALAVTQRGAETFVWIASDDNGELWQRSLLLKFRWQGADQRSVH